jgi:hypothetical protein
VLVAFTDLTFTSAGGFPASVVVVDSRTVVVVFAGDEDVTSECASP